jgi:hypothetical protein
LRKSALPLFVHFLNSLTAHPKKVDIIVARERADDNGEFVAATLGIDYVLE